MMVAFEDLVVRVAGNFLFFINEALPDGKGNGLIDHLCLEVFEDGIEAPELVGVIGKQENAETIVPVFAPVIN